MYSDMDMHVYTAFRSQKWVEIHAYFNNPVSGTVVTRFANVHVMGDNQDI